MATTVTIKVQVAIPKAVRELLGIKPGSKVDFRPTGNGIVKNRRADSKPVSSRFQNLRGHAGEGLSTDDIMALTRGDAWRWSTQAFCLISLPMTQTGRVGR
jgi:antitoxin PrlF